MENEMRAMPQPPPYYEPPPGVAPEPYPPQPGVVHTTTVYHGVTVVANVSPMGSEPAPTVCKSCHQQVTTKVKFKPTTKTHLFGLCLCIIGCWPCVCIPYCMNSCKNADHYCPNCESYLGSYIS